MSEGMPMLEWLRDLLDGSWQKAGEPYGAATWSPPERRLQVTPVSYTASGVPATASHFELCLAGVYLDWTAQ